MDETTRETSNGSAQLVGSNENELNDLMIFLRNRNYDGLLETVMDLRPNLQTTLERRGDNSLDKSVELLIVCTLWVLQLKGQTGDVKLFIKELVSQQVSDATEAIAISVKSVKALTELDLENIYNSSTAYNWQILQNLVDDTLEQFRQSMLKLICTRFKDINRQRAIRYLGGTALIAGWKKKDEDHVIPPTLSTDDEMSSQSTQEIIRLNAFIEQMLS